MSEDFFEPPPDVPTSAPLPPQPPWAGPSHGILPSHTWQLDFRVMLAVGNEELDPELNGIYERPGG